VWYVPQVSDLFAVCTDERRRPRSALSGLTDEGDGGRCVSLLRKGCGVGWRGFQFAKMKVDIPDCWVMSEQRREFGVVVY
jgi:hypothetical protein